MKGNPPSPGGSLFFLEGEIDTGAIIYRLMTAANGLARWSGTGKEYNWKLGDKEVGEKRMWLPFLYGPRMRMLTNGVLSRKGWVSNWMGSMICSVDTNQPLSSITLSLPQWALE